MNNDLKAALEELEKENVARASELLLRAWRSVRSAEIAEALAEISSAVKQKLDAPEKVKAWHPVWIERARMQNPLELPALLESLLTFAEPRNTSVVSSCLDEITWATDDPRLTKPLIALLEVRAGSSSWNKVHTRIFAILDKTNDPRAIEWLVPAIERSKVNDPSWSDAMQESLGRSAKLQAKLVERFPEGVPPLPREASAVISAIRARAEKPFAPVEDAPKPKTEGLLEQIWQNPHDEALRQVYADHLLEQGADVRAELIVLDAKGEKEKAAKLAAKNKTKLLGPLAKVVIAATFESGFLATCRADCRRKAEADVIFGRPEWATARVIDFISYAGLSSTMRSLVEAHGVSEAALESLAKIELPRLEILHFTGNASRGAGDSLKDGVPASAGLRALGAAKGLPRLRDLRIGLGSREYRAGDFATRGPKDFEWLLAAPFANQLVSLSVPYNYEAPSMLSPWLDVLKSHEHLERIVGQSGGVKLIVEKNLKATLELSDRYAQSSAHVHERRAREVFPNLQVVVVDKED